MKIVPAGMDRDLVDAIEGQGSVGLEFVFLSGHALEMVKEAQRRTGLSCDVVVTEALESYLFGLGSNAGTTEQGTPEKY